MGLNACSPQCIFKNVPLLVLAFSLPQSGDSTQIDESPLSPHLTIRVHTSACLTRAHPEVNAGKLEKSNMLALVVLLAATVGGVSAAVNGTRGGTKPHIVMFMMVSRALVACH